MFKCLHCYKYTLKEKCQCGKKTEKVGYKFKFKFIK